MPFWIFKTATQDVYSDEHGRRYVYDNRHSIRVAQGDSFVYLDKRRNQYAFTGHGTVHRLGNRAPNAIESQKPRVHTIYTAEIVDYVEYQEPVDIRPPCPCRSHMRERDGRRIRGLRHYGDRAWLHKGVIASSRGRHGISHRSGNEGGHRLVGEHYESTARHLINALQNRGLVR